MVCVEVHLQGVKMHRVKRKETADGKFPALRLKFCKNLESAVVEEHHQSVLCLHPLEQQRGRARDLLPTEKIPTLEQRRQKYVMLNSYPILIWQHFRILNEETASLSLP